jgi:hypothetical protein
MKYVKIITGFRDDQFKLIPAEEAHKAYYLFTHPNERTVFSNGVMLVGSEIRDVQPDINGLMGWKENYHPTAEDMGYVPKSFIKEARAFLLGAKDISYLAENNNEFLRLTITESRQKIFLLDVQKDTPQIL